MEVITWLIEEQRKCAGVIPGYDEYTLYGNDSLGWLSACDL